MRFRAGAVSPDEKEAMKMEEKDGPAGREMPEGVARFSDEELKLELKRLLSDGDTLARTLEILPSYARDLLGRVASGEISEEDFLREVFVGDCPNCEGSETVDCDLVEGIEDVTVGLCNVCGYLWCLECGVRVERGESCGHREACRVCMEDRDAYGECGISPNECPNIIEWMLGSGEFGLAASGCAWCGAEIGRDGEVFAIGARVKEGVEFTGISADRPRFLPVAVAGKVVPAMITFPDSRAKLEGNDVMFMACSEKCAKAFKVALVEEKSLNDRISLN